MNVIETIAFAICVTCAIANCLMALTNIRITLQNIRTWMEARIVRHALSDVEDELCGEIKSIAQSSLPSEYDAGMKDAYERAVKSIRRRDESVELCVLTIEKAMERERER